MSLSVVTSYRCSRFNHNVRFVHKYYLTPALKAAVFPVDIEEIWLHGDELSLLHPPDPLETILTIHYEDFKPS